MIMNSTVGICFLLLLLSVLNSCGEHKQEGPALKKETFGNTLDGREVFVYTLKNRTGIEARITNYGGIILSLLVPDRSGKLDDVVLGYESLGDYLKETPYFGALIGRCGNRIGKGRFTLNGVEYSLVANDGPNHLHGGLKGFDKVVWEVNEQESVPGSSLVLTYRSKDGEEGYPGNLDVKVVYALSDSNALMIKYEAKTDKPTVVNLTHHSYFNLEGAGKGDILKHELFIDADRFTPVGPGLIPTGELRPVRGTPMDFTTPTAIGARIGEKDEQLKTGGGYDHNWVLNRHDAGPVLAARVYEKTSGRVMEVLTTEPGLQFYSGNFLKGTNIGKGGRAYEYRFGFCLETQHFPDSPNRPEFPSTVLLPGQLYSTATIYRFSVK